MNTSQQDELKTARSPWELSDDELRAELKMRARQLVEEDPDGSTFVVLVARLKALLEESHGKPVAHGDFVAAMQFDKDGGE